MEWSAGLRGKHRCARGVEYRRRRCRAWRLRVFLRLRQWRVYVPGIAPVGLSCPKEGCLPDWPAVWSLPESHDSEIDAMEGLGTLGQACFHFHPPWPPGGEGGCESSSYAGWRTYGAAWKSGVVTYYYDGVAVGEVHSSYLNLSPQYLVMNMVPPADGQPLQVPDEIVVDYARVWQNEPSGARNVAYVGANGHVGVWYIEKGVWTEDLF